MNSWFAIRSQARRLIKNFKFYKKKFFNFIFKAAEAFFLCYSMFFPQSPKSTSTKEQTTTTSIVDNLQSLTQPQSTSINSSDSQPSSTVNLNDANSYQKEMFAFAGFFLFYQKKIFFNIFDIS